MVFESSRDLVLYSETYFTIPLGNPKIENALIELKKSLKFPTSAIPSAPTKMAIALEVKNPETMRIKIATELMDAILIKIL